MLGVKIPGCIQKEEDKTFIYENLFGLKWDANSGFIAKIGYYLSRAWVHIRGNLDTAVFKNLNQLTPEQEAIVFEVIHNNVEYFKCYDSWYRKFFEPKYFMPDENVRSFLAWRGLSLDKFDVIDLVFLRNISSVGKKALLEKYLELKPQQIDQKKSEDLNLIVGAVVSGDIETIKFVKDKGVDLTADCSYKHYAAKSLMDLIQHGYVKNNHKDVFITLYETDAFSLENASNVFVNSQSKFSLTDCNEILQKLFNKNSDKSLVIKTFETLLYKCLSLDGEHDKEKFFQFHRYVFDNFPSLEEEIIKKCRDRIQNEINYWGQPDVLARSVQKANAERNKNILMKEWFNSAIDVVRCEKDPKHLNDVADKLCNVEFMLESILETYQRALPALLNKQKTEDEKIEQLGKILVTFFEKSGPSRRSFGDSYQGLKAEELVFQGGIDKFDHIMEFMRNSHSDLASKVEEKIRQYMQDKIKGYDADSKNDMYQSDVRVGAEADANIYRARLEWLNQKISS